MARIHKLAAWSVVIVTAALLIAWPSPASANSVDVWGEVQSEIRLLFSGARRFWDVVGPGGKLHPAYFLEHKGHLVVEGLLILIIGYLFLQHSFKPHPKSEEPLTEKEVEQLCKEWKPEPLAPVVPEQQKLRSREIHGYDGKYIIADGQRALNLATSNYLNLSGTTEQLEVGKATVEKYGVGSCGPRGFYGTIDVHLQLEEQLAKFMGTDEAIIYSYDIATISSVIPAFANRKDVLVLDELCSFPIQQGATLSRAAVHFFKHNDMEDLERVLQAVDREEKRQKKPLNRRLIIVEGVYANYGDMAPLDKLYQLKEKYKWRLVVEESHSFGVLGKAGKGAAEHFGLGPSQVEVLCASMGNALGSVGGFCVGTEEIVEHQRLSGSGYCFSASLPPYLATCASVSLRTLGKQAQQLLPRLHSNAAALRQELKKVPAFTVCGLNNDISPLIHLHLAKPAPSREAAQAAVERVADHMLTVSGVLVATSHYSNLDRNPPPPGLRLCASAGLTAADITLVTQALAKAVKEALKL